MNSGSSCSESEPFALRVLGDSMLPEFPEGVIIIIDPEGVVTDSSYVMATVEEEYIFRQLHIVDEKYYLKPLNDLYDTVEISSLEDVAGVIIQKSIPGNRKSRKKYG